MQIAITGGTGTIGRALAAVLEEEGHDLVLLSRSGRSAVNYRRSVRWDPVAGPAPSTVLGNCRVVVHLAGEPVNGRWTRSKRERIERSRVLGTQNLVAGMVAANPAPQALISVSAIGYYGARGEQELNESASAGDGFLANVARGWEMAADQYAAAGNRVVTMRLGIVLGRGGMLQKILPLARLGLLGSLGNGRQWWSWIHIADLCRFIVAALDDIAFEGVYNLVAPTPVRQREFSGQLAGLMSRPTFLPVPEIALRCLLGGFSAELLDSKKVVPERLLLAGWDFEFQQLRPALAELLRTGGIR